MQLEGALAPSRLFKAAACLREVEMSDSTAAKRLGGATAVTGKLREMDDA